jgi:cell wall-associated NlpC family hydrolase
MSPDRSLHLRAGRALDAGAGDGVVVRAPVAPLVAEPRVSAMQTSQALAGHALAVEGREGDWLRVRGADDYPGWVHAGYVLDPDAALGPAGTTWYGEAELSLGCTVRGPHGRRALPLGAVLLPGERRESGDVVAAAACAERFPASGAAIVETARRAFEGTSYQWGGVTPWGADCSGLVQSVLALHGVPLPRDAWQQALEGGEAGDDPLRLEAADLLFFSDRADGRITHVGIATGDGRMVHLALGRGGYAVDRLDDPADPYVAMLRRNFRLARRALG